MQNEHLMYGPIPYSAFNPAPPTVGTTTDVVRSSKPDKVTIVSWAIIGGAFLLLAAPIIRSMVTESNQTVDNGELDSREHLEDKRDAIDTITNNATNSVETISDGTTEPATVVEDNASATIDAVSSESITEIQTVADQAKADLEV